mgnify:CR=1 FL=1
MNTIENQLTKLRLNGMHSSWKAMVETRQHHELSFGEGLEALLQAEAEDRTHRRFERLKKSAQFRYQASVEELNLDATRGINKTQITDREPPLWPVGKINPNPLEDDDSAGDKIYTNDVLHLLNSEDPLIDPLHGFDNQFEAYREDVIEALELISASDYGTSTGSWKEKSGMYTGLDLQSFADSNGGTSTGNDWLGDLF